MKISSKPSSLFVAFSVVLCAAPQGAFAQATMRPVMAPLLPTFAPIAMLTPTQMPSLVAAGSLSALTGTMSLAASAIPMAAAPAQTPRAAVNSAMTESVSGGARFVETARVGADRQMSEVLFDGSSKIADRPAKDSGSDLIVMHDGGFIRAGTLSGMTAAEAKSLWSQLRQRLSVLPEKRDYTEIPVRPSDKELAELAKKPGFIVSMGAGDEAYEVRLKSRELAIYRQKNPNPNWERFFAIPIQLASGSAATVLPVLPQPQELYSTEATHNEKMISHVAQKYFDRFLAPRNSFRDFKPAGINKALSFAIFSDGKSPDVIRMRIGTVFPTIVTEDAVVTKIEWVDAANPWK